MKSAHIRLYKELRYQVLRDTPLSPQDVGPTDMQSALRFVTALWFMEFCIDHNVLARFNTNILKCTESAELRCGTFAEIVNHLTNNPNNRGVKIWNLVDTCLKVFGNNPSQILTLTFLWGNTTEGYGFWCQVTNQMTLAWRKTIDVHPDVSSLTIDATPLTSRGRN